MSKKVQSGFKLAKTQHGFTLVELLIVISILGILAGVLSSSINAKSQQKRAQDAVNTGKLEQLSQVIEAFNQVEEHYPTSLSSPEDMEAVSKYISVWPAGFEYSTNVGAYDFQIIIKASNESYLKYSSVWGEIRNCSANEINVIDKCN